MADQALPRPRSRPTRGARTERTRQPRSTSRSAGQARDTRQALLAAGLALARKQGLRALTVREVATRANANLGSFVHHFGTRDAFVLELVERWYTPLFEQLRGLAAAPQAGSVKALRAVVLQLLQWLVQHRRFIALLLHDAAAGEAGVQRFLASLDQRHVGLLLGLIAQGQARGELRAGPPLQLLLFVMSTVAAPVLVFDTVQRVMPGRGATPGWLAPLQALVLEPQAIEERLGWALGAIAMPALPAPQRNQGARR